MNWFNEMVDLIEFKSFRFSIIDYIVFSLMLLLSTGTGIYFGYYKRYKGRSREEVSTEKMTTQTFGSHDMHEYLLGSRRLQVFPVAMSLVASYISGVTMLGTPSEIYNYGTQYFLILIPIMLMCIIVSTVYMPVFSKLKVGSSYEYLELRFNSACRSLASFMFVIDEILFLPIILYVPALAFKQVSGLNLHVMTAIVCIVCVIYTIVGGIKAVVHTDAWQILVMFASLCVVVIIGTINIGNPKQAMETASEGGRVIFFNFNPSLYERYTFWGVVIGGFFYWTSFNAVNQTMVQRYMALPTLRRGQCSVCIYGFGVIMFIAACCYAGLLVYDFYKDCDPLTHNLINHDDQLLPVYVIQTIGHLPGIPGLFIAGVFGASLSSLSVVLNSTSLVLLEDIVRGCFKLKLSERAAKILVKGSIIVLGVIALLLVFVLEKLGGILGVATAMTSIAAASTGGIFTLGMLIPWTNSKGALCGAISGALIAGWISFGSQYAMAAKLVTPHKLPISVSQCMLDANITETDHSGEENVFPLYRLSFLWINPIGLLTTLFVGIVVSFLTKPQVVAELDSDLISPVLHRFLPKQCFINASLNPKGSNIAQTGRHLLEDVGTSSEANTNRQKY